MIVVFLITVLSWHLKYTAKQLTINIFTRAAKEWIFSANKYYVAFMCHQNHSKYEFAGGKIGHERCIFKLYSTGKLIKF